MWVRMWCHSSAQCQADTSAAPLICPERHENSWEKQLGNSSTWNLGEFLLFPFPLLYIPQSTKWPHSKSQTHKQVESAKLLNRNSKILPCTMNVTSPLKIRTEGQVISQDLFYTITFPKFNVHEKRKTCQKLQKINWSFIFPLLLFFFSKWTGNMIFLCKSLNTWD